MSYDKKMIPSFDIFQSFLNVLAVLDSHTDPRFPFALHVIFHSKVFL